MFTILLIIIYLAFVSLGLPDPLLGASWPIMHEQMAVPMSYAGIISMITAGATIVSSLLSDRMTRRLGAGVVTSVSVLITAVSMFGFAYSDSFLVLCLWSVPYGLGAGAVDAALNNYVALHYAARHMNWLHSFWGVGTSISPYIMGWCLTRDMGWQGGYSTVGVLQLALTAVLFISLPLWKKRAAVTVTAGGEEEIPDEPAVGMLKAVRIRGVVLVLLTFFAYCSLETTAGLWASSYLVEHRGIDAETAARFASLFYLGITLGRLLSGFVSDLLGDRRLVRTGAIILCIGIVMVALPLSANYIALAGLVVIGFGCAPIYPSIIHSTPANFGRENSQAIIGIQMASAYTGSTFMPPVFGLIADHIHIGLYPIFLAVFGALILILSERLNRTIDKHPIVNA